jgi:hypothetical protein
MYWQGEYLVETAVVGDKILFDEFISGATDVTIWKLKVRQDAAVAIKAHAVSVSGEA